MYDYVSYRLLPDADMVPKESRFNQSETTRVRSVTCLSATARDDEVSVSLFLHVTASLNV